MKKLILSTLAFMTLPVLAADNFVYRHNYDDFTGKTTESCFLKANGNATPTIEFIRQDDKYFLKLTSASVGWTFLKNNQVDFLCKDDEWRYHHAGLVTEDNEILGFAGLVSEKRLLDMDKETFEKISTCSDLWIRYGNYTAKLPKTDCVKDLIDDKK